MSEYVQLIKDIAAISSLILSVLIFLINLILLKRKKDQKEKIKGEEAEAEAQQEEDNSVLAKALQAALFMKEAVGRLVIEAEDFINYSGKDKKAWVITKVKELCINNNVEYTEKAIDEAIEAVINITKRVNAPAQKQEQVAQEDAAAEKEDASC